MLSNQHFYHRITRKIVVAFGSLFNNLRLVKYNLAGNQEIERIIVPLTYASKEKFFVRITQDPTLFKEVSLTLPRMSFDLNSITYDPLRKTSSFVDSTPSDGGIIKRVKKVPYNFDFTLYIYVRNTEDGTQIVEQILPYFAPDYTVTVDLVSLDGLKLDVPIILNSIQYEDDDLGSPETTRTMTWTLTFTAKGYLFGLIDGDGIGGGKLIRKVTANLYSQVASTDKTFTFSSGNGAFKVGELVYQGNNINSATATAFVKQWEPLSNNLIVFDTTGSFNKGKFITGLLTGAKYNVATYSNEDYKVATITVVPDPLTANVGDDFGFTTTITEYV
jgi:hypothetical protein